MLARANRRCGGAIGAAVVALALMPAAASSATLEAAYVVLGGEGAVARAILSDAAECPALAIGNATAAMRIRARPETGGNAAFPVLVCEAPLPAGIASAAVAGRALPLPKSSLSKSQNSSKYSRCSHSLTSAW